MNFQESMLLWLPASVLKSEEGNLLVSSLSEINEYVFKFWEESINFDEMLMAIEFYGADPDDYCQTLDTNLRYFGG